MANIFSSFTMIDNVVSVEVGSQVYLFLVSKNQVLERKWGVNFFSAILQATNHEIIDTIAANQERRPDHQIMILNLHGYLYEVLFLAQDKTIWLKTFYRSRKMMLRYWGIKRKTKSLKKRLKKNAALNVSISIKNMTLSLHLKD